MGFRAPHDESLSIPPAEACSVLGSYTAVELLDVLDLPCYAALTDEVEFEIDHGAAADSVGVFIQRILDQMDPTSPWAAELLEQSGTDLRSGGGSVFSESVSTSDLDIAEIEFEIDHGADAGSVQALMDRVFAQMHPTSAWPADLLEWSETDTGEAGLLYNPGISGRESSVTEAERVGNAFDLSIDYHNPSSPWADSLLVGGAGSGTQYEGFIDYHNPSSPWADSLLVGGAGDR